MTPALPMPRPLPAVTPVVPVPLICASAISHITVRTNAAITLLRTKLGEFIVVAPSWSQANPPYSREGGTSLLLDDRMS
jgi:hypothetical protein